MGKKKTGTVRIIGGKWRGRRLPVPEVPGLRPSGDRSRETLFNWLAPHLHGSRCADLFAGTGVLGFEAASRGARSVVLVEKSSRAVDVLRENLAVLAANESETRIEVLKGDALKWLDACQPGGLDIVYIDPPFGLQLETQVLAMLADGNCLADGALVYLETARQGATFEPGPGWETAKEKVVGDVHMRLLKKN